ncbi:hypothetical protein MUG87_16430 [Ectobacillus sp. JY-23]|uniref:hypothetical protein n=1 Tax=Ectobacillus sp. JY-23 TaxID=2933872 RepID=UPI001FF14AE0|nr:hypothetical protein [Ectobacillus sp. JY-23]UOY92009.1 hypothetical protein MUG87_16430 [Ectobacillus sp. JY-23]
MSDKLTLFKVKYRNGQTCEKVEVVTIIIDGVFQQVFNQTLADSQNHSSYEEVLRDAIMLGTNELVKALKRMFGEGCLYRVTLFICHLTMVRWKNFKFTPYIVYKK